jgi:serine phosphatase RsbU (regulator of sigma subunit)
MVEAIKTDVAGFVDGAEQSDDITVLALKRL